MIARNAEGQITFTADDRSEIVDALKEMFATEIGKDYRKNYYTPETADEDTAKILRAAQLITGSENITVAAMIRGLELLIDSGEIKPRDLTPTAELTEPEPDTRPRTKDGKLMTDAQIKWSEYRRFSETASMDQINRRKASDPSFRSFAIKQYQREAAQEVGDAVVAVGQGNIPSSKQISGDLVNFAHAYRVEPSENLKPKSGYVVLQGKRLPYSQLIEQVTAATAAGLL